LLRELADGDVDFVIVGGIAAVLHGSPTVTHDLDIVFAADRKNLEALGSVLTSLGARLWGVEETLPFQADARTLDGVDLLALETDAGRIDVMRRPIGAPEFGELRDNADVVEIEGRRFRIAAIDDLIAMKRAAGRPKDIAAVTELEAIKRLAAAESAPE
jgi:predicted nucleotidyltransferase